VGIGFHPLAATNSAFLASYLPQAMERGSGRLAEEFGVPISHLALRRINGDFHIQVVPPVGKPDA